jgi:hypothetical protein
VYGQTIPDGNLAEALGGVFFIINRAAFPEEHEAGQTLDGSLKWEYAGGERDALRVVFRNFRYYAAREDPSKNRVAALSGDLELDMEDELITGAVAVKGIPQVSSLAFDRFYRDEGGSLEVNGRPCGPDRIEDILEEALGLLEDRVIITPEIEAGIVFFAMLSAIEEAGLSVSPPGDTDGGAGIPPGITGSNPEGTITFVTRPNVFEISFRAYEYGEAVFQTVPPLLDGKFVIEYRFKPGSMSAVVWDSRLGVRNLTFVSSMGFDSCLLGESISDEGISGTIIMNGAGHEFLDFLRVLAVLDNF